MTNISEMQGTAANGSENAVNGDAVSRLASVYAWDDTAFKENPEDMRFFRASKNIIHDLGIKKPLLPAVVRKELERLGAVQSLTPEGEGSGKTQTNPDNPADVTGRAQGWFMPPLVQRSEADDAGGALSDVQAFVERGEDGQVLEHEVGQFAGGAGGSVSFDLNFVDAVATVEPTTTPTETRKAEEFPEFWAVDLSRVVGAGRSLTPDSKPSYLLGRNPAIGAAVNRVHGLGCIETLVAAVSYAGMGLRSFPLVAGGKTPAVANGFKVATSEVSQLVNWFDDGEFFQRSPHHDKNLGIATGETDCDFDLVVLDVDVKDGKDGLLVFGRAEGEFGKLPTTLTAGTPSGGWHYVFKVPKGSGIGCTVDVFKQHGKGLDIRGHGGYIAASPSVVNGKPYQWLNDLLPVMLPDSWIAALQAECPVGGKRVAVSGSGNSIQESNQEPLTDQQRADVHEVIHTFTTTVIAKNMKREDWLIVMAAAKNSGFDPEALRPWSELNADKDGFETTWNSNLEAHPLAILKAGFLEPFGITNPATRGKAEQEAAALSAEREQAGFGKVPDWMKGILPRGKVSMPIAAVSDEKAKAVLDDFIAKGGDVAERVQAGENVGHDVEHLFIAGMLTMNAGMVKYQVEHNPVPKDRSSKYHTKAGKVRAVIMHSGGSKPATADGVNMDLFTPDYVGGTADAATRLANRLMLERDAALGNKPTDDECALVHHVLELSPLGNYWRENATEISKGRNGWSLKSAVDNGLSRATRYSTNTHAAVGGSSNGLAGVLPKTGTRLSWIDRELTHQGGAVGELLDTPTSDQIESLLSVYGCRAVFDEMRDKVAVHGMPKRFLKLDHIVTAIRELAARHDTEWQKHDVTDFLKLLSTGTRYHPALEWVRRIPWDGVDRFKDLLATVEPEDGYSEMWRIGLHRWCMGAVRCLVQPEGMSGVPTIVFYAPAGGEGKDRWQQSLCPLEFQARPKGFDPGNLNWMVAALNGWLGSFPEITTQSKKAEIEHIKAFLTADKDSYTSKYEMDVNDRLRRTVYLASTNESDYLADRTGTNRRFITVAVKSINYRHSIDMQQFWAQMMHTFEAAWAVSDEHVHRYWLEGAESKLLTEVNETHVVADLMEDQIKALWDFDNEAWLRDKRRTDWAVSVQAVSKMLDPDSAMNTSNIPQMFMKRIAREMSRLGIIKKQMRGRDGNANYYLLPPSRTLKPSTV